MPRNAGFLMCRGDQKPGREFLINYQKCILLSLQQEGIIDQEQFEKCIKRLENQGFQGENI